MCYVTHFAHTTFNGCYMSLTLVKDKLHDNMLAFVVKVKVNVTLQLVLKARVEGVKVKVNVTLQLVLKARVEGVKVKVNVTLQLVLKASVEGM